jgi:hypothetical protein
VVDGGVGGGDVLFDVVDGGGLVAAALFGQKSWVAVVTREQIPGGKIPLSLLIRVP